MEVNYEHTGADDRLVPLWNATIHAQIRVSSKYVSCNEQCDFCRR